MRLAILILILSFHTSLYAQNIFRFSIQDIHFTELNPDWVKGANIHKIIEREYLGSDKGRLHSVSTHIYNKNGFLVKHISGLSYPANDVPDEEHFISYVKYRYEMIDSFLFQFDQVVRHYNEQGKMALPDSLPETMGRCYHRMINIPASVKCQGTIYTFDEFNRLSKIKAPAYFFLLNYEDGHLASAARESNKKTAAFIPNSTCTYQYNRAGLLTSSSDMGGMGSMNTKLRYYYSDKAFPLKREMLFGDKVMGTYTYEYVFY